MNRTRWTIAAAAISLTLVLAVAGLAARADAKDPAPHTPAPAPTEVKLPTVQLAKVKQVFVTARSDVTGTLQPAKAVQFGFELNGRLKQLLVKKGARISQGQLLARLDPEIANAQVVQAESALKAAQASAAIAADALRRSSQLLSAKALTEQQAEAAKNQSLAADAQVLAARAQLSQARAIRRRHELRAPFAGVLVDAPDQVGAYVNVNTSPITFAIEQLDTLTLKVTASESDRPLLLLGSKVHVEATSRPVSTDAATISAIIPSADAQTRRIPVEISVPNRKGQFTAHTLARAQLPLGAKEQALSVSASALASTGGDHLFVLGEGGAVRRVAVTVLERGATEVVFRAPEALEQVVDFPAVDLDAGMKVSVR